MLLIILWQGKTLCYFVYFYVDEKGIDFNLYQQMHTYVQSYMFTLNKISQEKHFHTD